MAGHGRMTTERAKDFKGTLRQLLSALGKYKFSLGIACVFAILSTIFNIAGPKAKAPESPNPAARRPAWHHTG